jgi:hypothetical protein
MKDIREALILLPQIGLLLGLPPLKPLRTKRDNSKLPTKAQKREENNVRVGIEHMHRNSGDEVPIIVGPSAGTKTS